MSDFLVGVQKRGQFKVAVAVEKGDASPCQKAQPVKDTSGSDFLHSQSATEGHKFQM